jgi:5,10-methylenetetrahydromethanopterin reductase
MFALGADVERLKWGIALAKKTRREAGLDPDGISFGAYLNMGCHTDMETARSLVRGGLTTFARFSVMHGKTEVPTSTGDKKVLEALISNYDMKAHTRGDSRQATTLTDDFVDRMAIVGPPARCIERLKELQALGLDKVAISGATRGASEGDAAVGRKLVTEHLLPGVRGGV